MKDSVRVALAKVQSEFKNQPFGSAAAALGVVVLAYNAITGLPSVLGSLPAIPSLNAGNFGFVLKLSGLLLVQGTLATMTVRMQHYFAARGHGFPYILNLIGTLMASWLAAYNVFIFLIADMLVDGTLAPAVLTFIAFMILTMALNLYFGVIYFHRNRLEGSGDILPPRFGRVLFLMLIGVVVMTVHFGIQIGNLKN
jgi:hypothetical protein